VFEDLDFVGDDWNRPVGTLENPVAVWVTK